MKFKTMFSATVLAAVVAASTMTATVEAQRRRTPGDSTGEQAVPRGDTSSCDANRDEALRWLTYREYGVLAGGPNGYIPPSISHEDADGVRWFINNALYPDCVAGVIDGPTLFQLAVDRM